MILGGQGLHVLFDAARTRKPEVRLISGAQRHSLTLAVQLKEGEDFGLRVGKVIQKYQHLYVHSQVQPTPTCVAELHRQRLADTAF